MKLRNKFLIPTLALVIIGMGISAVVSYTYSKAAIKDLASVQINQFAESTATQITSWLNDTKLNVIGRSRDMTYKTAVQDSFLGESAREAASEKLLAVQQNYEGIENALLFDAKGDTVAADNPDLTGSLQVADRTYFQEAMDGKTVLSEVLTGRSSGLPVITVSAPVMQYGDKTDGVLAVGIQVEYIAKTFIEPIKIGATGHAYICDGKGLIIAHTDMDKTMKTNIGNQPFGKKILSQNKGMITYFHEGREEMAAFMKMKTTGWYVVILAHTSELLAPARNIGYINLALAVSIIIILGLIIFFISLGITRPLGAEPAVLSEVAQKIALGELAFQFRENGKVNKGVYHHMRQMTESLKKKALLAEKIADGDLTNDVTLSSDDDMLGNSLKRMTENLRSMLFRIKSNSGILTDSSEALFSVSTTLADSVEEMNTGTQNISSTSEQMSAIMNSIASAIEEMSVSINQIAKNAKEGAEVSDEAKSMSDGATDTINMLGKAATEIGEVTELIKQIAQQTNLLALNATIEAASAGDAGKGFAVVANEIKELANESAKAAEKIAKQITGVQLSAGEAVQAIGKVSETIDRLNESSTMITQSVEQQTVAANEISSSVQEANQGVGSIAMSIADLAGKTVNEISDRTHQVKNSSDNMAKVAARLQEMIDQFKIPEAQAGEVGKEAMS